MHGVGQRPHANLTSAYRAVTCRKAGGKCQCRAASDTRWMDPIRFGRQIRALRRRRGWRQVDLALLAGTSRATISRLELGRAEESTLRAIDTVARVLSARLDLRLSWNGEALDRLLDADHARLVDMVARELRADGWDVVVEASFNLRGERGSIDVLAFHRATRVVVVIEVKSVVPDLQASLHLLDRKTRLAIEIGRERGWDPVSAGRILAVADGRTVRRRIGQHAAVFDVAFPARTAAVKRWLRRPAAGRPFSGLWFLADGRRASARHRIARVGSRAAA